MARSKDRHALQSLPDGPISEVLILADLVGKAAITLIEVLHDFLEIVPNPVIAGGFAMAHHGFVRATVDIDVIALGSTKAMTAQFVERGYKKESVHLPIGEIELLTKGNKGVDFIHLANASFQQSIQQRAVVAELFSHKIRFISLEDLILLKSLAVNGRTNKWDEGDLEKLLTLSHDNKYVEVWKKKLRM